MRQIWDFFFVLYVSSWRDTSFLSPSRYLVTRDQSGTNCSLMNQNSRNQFCSVGKKNCPLLASDQVVGVLYFWTHLVQFVQFASTKRGVLAVIFFHFSKLYKEYSRETKSKIDVHVTISISFGAKILNIDTNFQKLNQIHTFNVGLKKPTQLHQKFYQRHRFDTHPPRDRCVKK